MSISNSLVIPLDQRMLSSLYLPLANCPINDLFFFLSRTISYLRDLLTHSSLQNQWLWLIPAFKPSGVSTLNYLLFPVWQSFRVEDPLTLVLNNQTVMMNSGSLAFEISFPSTHTNLRREFPRSDRSSATHPLQINDPHLLQLFSTKTRSTVLRPPPRSMIEISFKTSVLSSSAFLRSAPYPKFQI